MIYADYQMKEWFQLVKGHEKDPERGERCSICFDIRLEKTFEYAKRGGFDMAATTLSISPYRLLFSEITITGSYSCTPLETRQALKLIQGGRIDVEGLITHRFDLAGVGEAIDLANKGGESLKIVIRP